MILLMGYVNLNPSDVNEFTADVQNVVSSTRTETGCRFYAFTLEDARAGRMLTVQRWEDQESLTAHVERHESAPFLMKWGNRMRMDIQKYDISNERSFME
ncbi:putative quinol monooxygenase [Paenibacillus agricola]|uniref:Antibiotic biosynthesis monooxygenase n=1 Tax=Paenibacillus agricola TaxID=2716264 RepID=A0ABX0J1Y5_9BACL|nr:antibiotic biosynthesis monooxygenase family protein [Paenibacillus agricola]NHN29688.1 antibiotic biosynthesis monooxygenase [Paenibacillus agricola]